MVTGAAYCAGPFFPYERDRRTRAAAAPRVDRCDGWSVCVFDLSRDIGERNDLAGQRQDIARQLPPLITAWEADVNAEAK